MRLPCLLAASFLALPMVLATAAVSGQNYPDKPVRIIGAEAGGGADATARLIAQGLSANLGQQFIVDNRGGAGGAIAAQAVSKAPPDGYTLLIYSSVMWIAPLLQEVSWDPFRDFAPVSLAANSPNVLVVHPSVPARTVQELIALAKAKPSTLNYASGGSGSSPHLAAELFNSMAGIKIVRIPYKGIGAAISDLIAGQVELTFGAAGSVAPHIKSGRLRALGVTSAQPSLSFPGVPTVASSGLPGYEAQTIYGMWSTARTPAAVISRLNSELVRVLGQPDVKAKLLGFGVEPVASTPDRLTAFMKSDSAVMGKLIKDAGIRAE